jgi:hypothetical protein
MFFIFLILNFGISCLNARSAGRVWSESKAVGGALRFNAVIAYAMAVAGFTMVYGVVIILLLPVILPLFMEIEPDALWSVQQLTNDLLYLMIGAFAIPTGFYIWYMNFISFWRRRSLSEGLRLSWNTFATIRNTISFARHAPSALGRVVGAFTGSGSGERSGGGGRSRGRSDGKGAIVMIAALLVVLALLGGWMTASAIMHRADAAHDYFNGMRCYDEPVRANS